MEWNCQKRWVKMTVRLKAFDISLVNPNMEFLHLRRDYKSYYYYFVVVVFYREK